MSLNKRPLVVLTGPTSVGKTALSIALAKAVNGAIISADSMQVYKHMDIGSAKITKEEMNGVPHYLVDVISPFEEFHIARFKELADKALEEIYESGKLPIVVGGTGFYIQALLYQVEFAKQDQDFSFRSEQEAYAKEFGNHALHEKLRDIDPISYEKIHENNVKRVIRALEYYHLTKTPISKHNEEESQKESPYNFAYFVLNDEREQLYQRIDTRVDRMVQNGLVEEVQSLKAMGCTKDMVSMQGLGYKEILDYLDGKCSLEEAIDTVKQETRHFAKRQLTWFRRETDVIWLNKQDFFYEEDRILKKMLDILSDKGIIGKGEKGHWKGISNR